MGDPSADWPEVSAGQHELIVTAVSDDQILLPNGNIALAGSGGTRTVTLSPAADQHGSVVITFKVSDGIDQDTATWALTVNAINDAPSYLMGDDVTVAEDPGGLGVPQTVSNWATSLDAGTAGTTGISGTLGDESGQTLTFALAPSSGDFSDLFSQAPYIDSSGNLTYTLKPHAYGQIGVNVSLSDGVTTVTKDASEAEKTSFTVRVLMVNDAPFFDQGGNQHVAG